MADEDLKARLYEHSKAFESLMALVPADYYYGKNNSDQWQQKKQTKEERQAAKKAKLEPGAYKSALDVHKEREREHLKRKRELEEGPAADVATEGPHDDAKPAERPPKKSKTEKTQERKARKEEDRQALAPEEDEAIRQQKAEKRREQNRRKKEAKKEGKQKLKEKKKARKQKAKQAHTPEISNDNVEVENTQPEAAPPKKSHESSKKPSEKQAPKQKSKREPEKEDGAADEIEFGGLDDDASSAGSSPEQETVFDNLTNHSSASSSSSIVPPSNPSERDSNPKQSAAADDSHSASSDADDLDANELGDQVALPSQRKEESSAPVSNESSDIPSSKCTPGAALKSNATYLTPQPSEPSNSPSQLPKIDREALTKRLSDKLAALRAARKADGPDGRPARNRAELIEARRRKAEARKQRKKEQRAKDREARDAETEAARLRGGNGSPNWSPSMYSPGGILAQQAEPSFQFGKVVFDGGAEIDVGRGVVKGVKSKKGPMDPRSALVAAEKNKARIAGYDGEKRAEIEEKNAWMHVRQRVTGERAKDDPNLLKKTLKRKEKAKEKSERAWNERQEGVRKGQEMRQKKREDNLRKRKEEKGIKGKDRKKMLAKQKGKDGVQKPKPRKRPGFEGTFKTAARRT